MISLHSLFMREFTGSVVVAWAVQLLLTSGAELGLTAAWQVNLFLASAMFVAVAGFSRDILVASNPVLLVGLFTSGRIDRSLFVLLTCAQVLAFVTVVTLHLILSDRPLIGAMPFSIGRYNTLSHTVLVGTSIICGVLIASIGIETSDRSGSRTNAAMVLAVSSVLASAFSDNVLALINPLVALAIFAASTETSDFGAIAIATLSLFAGAAIRGAACRWPYL